MSDASISGDPAVCVRVIDNSYVDRDCVLSHKGQVVDWHLREVDLGYPPTPGPVNSITVRAQYLFDFQTIVQSIHFTNP